MKKVLHSSRFKNKRPGMFFSFILIVSFLSMATHFNLVQAYEENSSKEENLSDGHMFIFGKPVSIDEPDWFVSGAAGIVSTANDMANWLIMQQNLGKFQDEVLLSSDRVQAMHWAMSWEGTA